MKKLLSFIMSFVLLLTIVLPTISVAAADECTCDYTPIVYIKGRSGIYKDRNNLDAGRADKSISNSDGSVKEAALNISGALVKALATDDWHNYCNVLYDEIIPLYDQYSLNDDGEIDNSSGIMPYWDKTSIIERIYAYGKNYHIENRDNIEMYPFQYDCRLDPCNAAADLNDVIKAVIDVTGHEKVKIVARCQGTVIANAYFNIYGWDDVEDVFLYNSIACGTEISDSIFCGDISFLNSEAWNRFLNDYLDVSPIYDLIKASVDVSVKNGSFSIVTGLVQKIYDKIEPDIMPRLIKDTFGRCPGWYSMISYDKTDECINFILDGNRTGQYDALIEKINNYNDNYKENTRGVLEDMQADGVNVYIVAKYDSQMYPFLNDANILGDNDVSVYKQTYNGATCADTTKTLSEEYLSSVDEKYISPDKMIDSSTGLFPEHTWYIRDLQHSSYPDAFNKYILKILRYDGYTSVSTFEDVPQWLLYVGSKSVDADTDIQIMTSENASVEGRWPDSSFFKSMINLLQKFFALVKFLIAQKNAA